MQSPVSTGVMHCCSELPWPQWILRSTLQCAHLFFTGESGAGRALKMSQVIKFCCLTISKVFVKENDIFIICETTPPGRPRAAVLSVAFLYFYSGLTEPFTCWGLAQAVCRWKSLVLFCLKLWRPHLRKHSAAIERVKFRFPRRVSQKCIMTVQNHVTFLSVICQIHDAADCRLCNCKALQFLHHWSVLIFDKTNYVVVVSVQ